MKDLIVTIHQPEHFPYEGFFKKMEMSDIFVILDSVKFKKNNFQNRNRLVNNQGKEEWFGFPVPKKSNSMIINEVVACDESVNPWRKKLLKNLKYNLDIEADRFYNHETLIEINMSGINWVRDQLKINTPIVYSSQLAAAGAKTDLLVEICKELGASEYISGNGGREYLDLEMFKSEDIKVSFFQSKVSNYYSMLYNLSK